MSEQHEMVCSMAQEHNNYPLITTVTSQLRALSKVFEGKLDHAGLSGKPKLTMQFCLAPACILLRQCYDRPDTLTSLPGNTICLT